VILKGKGRGLARMGKESAREEAAALWNVKV